MNQTEMTMGRRIAARRKELKMTQEALAQELGVSAQAVSKWENDLSCPDISILPKLAKTLGLTTDALLGAEPEGPVSPALPVPADPEEEDDRPGIYVESDNGRKWDIHFDAPKKASFSLAGWLICTALLMLIGPLLKINGANSIRPSWMRRHPPVVNAMRWRSGSVPIGSVTPPRRPKFRFTPLSLPKPV